ncbi:hypothetical protein Tco_0189545 [Tanacetum coccineum]
MSEAKPIPPTSSVTALRIPMIKKGEYDLCCDNDFGDQPGLDELDFDASLCNNLKSTHDDRIPWATKIDEDAMEDDCYSVAGRMVRQKRGLWLLEIQIKSLGGKQINNEDMTGQGKALMAQNQKSCTLVKIGLGDFDWSNKLRLHQCVSSFDWLTTQRYLYCSKCSNSIIKLLEKLSTEKRTFQKAGLNSRISTNELRGPSAEENRSQRYAILTVDARGKFDRRHGLSCLILKIKGCYVAFEMILKEGRYQEIQFVVEDLVILRLIGKNDVYTRSGSKDLVLFLLGLTRKVQTVSLNFLETTGESKGKVPDWISRIAFQRNVPDDTKKFHYLRRTSSTDELFDFLGKSTAGVANKEESLRGASRPTSSLAVFYIQQKQNITTSRSTNKLVFACFLSQEEPKKVSQALADEIVLDVSRHLRCVALHHAHTCELVYVDRYYLWIYQVSCDAVKDFEDLSAKGIHDVASMGELTFFLGLHSRCKLLLVYDWMSHVFNCFKTRHNVCCLSCARFQSSLIKLFAHLHAVKGGCQYLGRRLVSWQCKKQTIVAISSTEAEYVAAASCCARQVVTTFRKQRSAQRGALIHGPEIFLHKGCARYCSYSREVRRLKKQTLSQAKQIHKLKAKLKKLSKFVQPVVKHHAFWVESQNLKKRRKKQRKKHKKKVSSVKLGRNKDEEKVLKLKNSLLGEKEASDVKSGDTEELDLEIIQSTARQKPEEQFKVNEVLADISLNISRPRGLSIPGPIQSQPQQPTQATDPKDKGKGILVEEPKKKKLTLQQIRALETTNDEEVARKIQAEWDAEEERKRLEELKKAKQNILKKPTFCSRKESNDDFLKGQGYKNFKSLEKEKQMLQERDAKRLSRKRKATITEEQPSKKLKLRAETIDELRNYLRIVDFEKNAQDRESLEGISMITELQIIDSPNGEYLIIHRANNHFRAFDTLWEILHILDRQDLYHLYRVVQDYYEHIPPTGLGLILLGDLTIIWETAETSDDDFWKDQEEWEIIRWRFHESSGVHTLEIEDGTMIHMLAERRYPLSRELMIRMLDHGMEVEDENETAITLIHLFILWTTEDGGNS